ncbi:MAG: NAD-dependent epimerase/dehydratase family protein [Clostridia bacterium]|nr:NAD-dependent epimerase/dehydratase family protein [Clostridia bacterium]
MILITGLTGTSGKAFYKVLCENNFDEKIRVVVRKTTDLSIFENTPLNLEFAVGDICDLDFMKKAVEGARLVFHIAAKGKAKNVVEAICTAPQKPFACMVSSTIVYSNYYRTSYLKEDEKTYVQNFNKNGIKYVFIRPTMIFGTPTDRNISIFSCWFKKYPIFPIVKKGRATIQPVHIEDLAAAYYLIMSNSDKLKSDDYIVSGKDEMTLLEMFKTISEVLKTKTIYINIPFPIAALMVNFLYHISLKRIDFREKLDRLTEDRAYSHKKISDEFGYAPLSFKERLEQTVKKYSDYA